MKERVSDLFLRPVLGVRISCHTHPEFNIFITDRVNTIFVAAGDNEPLYKEITLEKIRIPAALDQFVFCSMCSCSSLPHRQSCWVWEDQTLFTLPHPHPDHLASDGWSFLFSLHLFNHLSITHHRSVLPPPSEPAAPLRPLSDSIHCPMTQRESMGAEGELLSAHKETVEGGALFPLVVGRQHVDAARTGSERLKGLF